MEFFRQKGFIKRFNAADRRAFLAVYDFFTPRIFRYIYYKCGHDKGLAEELTQYSFVKIWEYVASHNRKGIVNIQAFLYRIARNALVDHWRKSAKAPLPLMEELIEVADDASWQVEVERGVEVRAIARVLAQIPEQYKEVIELRYFEGLEIAEICDVLEKSSNSVYVLLHRALKVVRMKILANGSGYPASAPTHDKGKGLTGIEPQAILET